MLVYFFISKVQKIEYYGHGRLQLEIHSNSSLLIPLVIHFLQQITVQGLSSTLHLKKNVLLITLLVCFNHQKQSGQSQLVTRASTAANLHQV